MATIESYPQDFINDYQVICASRDNTQVIEQVKNSALGERFLADKYNGEVWGVYYDEQGNVIVELNGEETYIVEL